MDYDDISWAAFNDEMGKLAEKRSGGLITPGGSTGAYAKAGLPAMRADAAPTFGPANLKQIEISKAPAIATKMPTNAPVLAKSGLRVTRMEPRNIW